MKAVVEHALGPVREITLGADVLDDHRLAGAHGHARGSPPIDMIGRPAQGQVLQVVGVVPRMCHRKNGLLFIILRKTDPPHAVATDVHRNLADGLQQSGF
ncbi:hypothetical protein D3C71_1908320 [compost metagenome]